MAIYSNGYSNGYGSGSGKTNTLMNSINEQDDIDKIYLYVKDLSELKYEFLIKKHEILE